jgi:3-oxoacyl-[acyl-carrier-protein] synthase II
VTACSTGVHAIGDAARLIALGDADVMVAGGAEGRGLRARASAASAACKALSTNFNDTPAEASRPWSKDRDGFVMGEGAGIVVLEELRARQGSRRQDLRRGHRLRHVRRRLSHHGAAEDGDGAYRCMKAALKRAGVKPSEIDYVNAHGTSTFADDVELKRGRAHLR